MVAKFGKPLVMVEWLDAETTYGWESDDEVNSDPAPAITVGFLVKRTEDLIVIASTIDSTHGTTNNSRIKIPIGMVVGIKELSGAKSPHKKRLKPTKEEAAT